MDKTELITNAILDKYISGIQIYTSSDILVAAGISEKEALKLVEQLKTTVRNQYSE